MIFLTFGTGLGAGLILNGKVYEGANGNAGEAGHIRLAPNGPFGYGKYGSFEGFCSGGGIAGLAEVMARRRKKLPQCIVEAGGRITANSLRNGRLRETLLQSGYLQRAERCWAEA